MKWVLRISTVILVVSVVELYLLLELDRLTNHWVTLAMILVPALLGSWLIKREGGATWKRLKGRLDEGDLPSSEVVDGVIVLIAGTLLLTPGVLTDITGILLLVPPVRRRLRRMLLRRARQANPESLWALLLTDDDGADAPGGWVGTAGATPRTTTGPVPPPTPVAPPRR